jgi:hypothetical protein
MTFKCVGAVAVTEQSTRCGRLVAMGACTAASVLALAGQGRRGGATRCRTLVKKNSNIIANVQAAALTLQRTRKSFQRNCRISQSMIKIDFNGAAFPRDTKRYCHFGTYRGKRLLFFCRESALLVLTPHELQQVQVGIRRITEDYEFTMLYGVCWPRKVAEGSIEGGGWLRFAIWYTRLCAL